MKGFDWGEFKLALSAQLHVSEDALHVHAGLAILFLAALLLRRVPWSRWPVAAVALVEGLNEAYDLYTLRIMPDDSGLAGSIHDFVLTLLWPVLLLVAVPWFRRWARTG